MSVLDNDPFTWLKEMAVMIQSRYVVILSLATLSKFLHKRFSSFKTVRLNVVEKNSERVRNLRNCYVTRLLEEGWRRQEMIFID